MKAAEEISAAIRNLSLEERAQIAADLCGWEDDDWDRQMKTDAAQGKLDVLNAEAAQAGAAGKTRPLTELLGE
jgi:hypothetical protein